MIFSATDTFQTSEGGLVSEKKVNTKIAISLIASAVESGKIPNILMGYAKPKAEITPLTLQEPNIKIHLYDCIEALFEALPEEDEKRVIVPETPKIVLS
jgi:hypothetical protein